MENTSKHKGHCPYIKMFTGRNCKLPIYTKNCYLKSRCTVSNFGDSHINIKCIQQTCQNKVLRNMVKAHWYAHNQEIHRDLDTSSVIEEIKFPDHTNM